MKKFYGNYLGLCIDNNDPQKRGRVQVFVPHILPTLFENWNEVGEDIQLLCVGDNLPASIPPDILEKLKKVLPWAEASLPIMSTSAPGNLVTGAAAGGYQPDVVGGMAGAGVAVPQGGSYYDQSPVPDPDTSTEETPIATGLGNANYSNLTYDKAWQGEGQDPGFKALLSRISTELGKPFYINSGYRSPEYNNKVSDTGFSGPHTEGTAADISTASWTNEEKAKLINIASANGIKGIGIYNSFIHLDTSKNGVRTWGPTPSWASTAIANHKNRSTYQSRGIGRVTSTSSQTAATNPLNSPNPIDERASIAVPVAGNTGGGGGTLSAPGVGQVSGSGNYTVNVIPGASKNRQDIPYDGRTAPIRFNNPGGAYPSSKFEKFGMTGYGIIGGNHPIGRYPTVSHGIASNIYMFQNMPVLGMSVGEARNYWVTGRRGGFMSLTGMNNNQVITNELLRDSNFLAQWMRGTAQDEGFGKISDQQMADGLGILQQQSDFVPGTDLLPTSEIETGSLAGTSLTEGNGLPQTGGNLVGNPDSWGPTPVINMNNMAAGMFAYPAAGALLWVFFREGNPLFPVYFGASYGEREWASAYRLPGPGQDGVGYKPSAADGNPITSYGGTWSNKAFVHTWHCTDDPTNPLNNERSYAIGGHDGSNISFTEGLQTFFTKFDRRDQIEGDRWVTTLGYEERWNQGNTNSNTLGDVVVRIGNTSQEAVDAVNKINDYIKQIMQPLTVSDCSEAAQAAPTGQMSQDGTQAVNEFGQTVDEPLPPIEGDGTLTPQSSSPYGETANQTAGAIFGNTPQTLGSVGSNVVGNNARFGGGSFSSGRVIAGGPTPAVFNTFGDMTFERLRAGTSETRILNFNFGGPSYVVPTQGRGGFSNFTFGATPNSTSSITYRSNVGTPPRGRPAAITSSQSIRASANRGRALGGSSAEITSFNDYLNRRGNAVNLNNNTGVLFE